MTLRPDFKIQLLEILKESALLIDKSRKYREVCNEYKITKQKINDKLSKISDLPCKDCEDFINKQTGKLISNLNIDNELKILFQTLENLFSKKQQFGWKDEIDWSVKVILGLEPLKTLEKEIFSYFGNKEGRKIINDAKIEISKFEKENNICVFSDDIENLNALDSILVLYSKSNTVNITKNNNLIEEIITLETIDGKCIDFKKYGQLIYNNKIYLSLEIIEKLNDQEYFFYVVEQTNDGQKFIMEQDEDILDIIYLEFERYTTQTLIEKNKKNK